MDRCEWAESGPEMIAYHDDEWGVPSRDDVHLFEMITLEGAQAGLSWTTILRKRDGYRRGFKGFDVAKVARLTDRDVERLMADAGIVRNRAKIESTIANARAIRELGAAGGSLSELLWSFVGDEPIVNRWRKLSEIPAQTAESKAMSRELKKRGFRFVGPTICYALMQATGMVNDHLTSCDRYLKVSVPSSKSAAGRTSRSTAYS
ncbi:MAG: DNA-3-methyladenine glycosylase I [Actinomycetota bacterium]